MANPPLVLSVRCRDHGIEFNPNEPDEKTMHAYSLAFKRDGNTCMFCGFKSNQLQEIHHLNGDHTDNAPSNLAPICEFCHMVQHLGRNGYFWDSTLIWLPELSQAALNHLVRTVLVAQRHVALSRARKGQRSKITRLPHLSGILNAVSQVFRLRQRTAISRIGTCKPFVLGQALMSLTDSEYERRDEILGDLKLLPHGLQTRTMHRVVECMVDAWMGKGGPYYRIPPESWGGILEYVMFGPDSN